MKFANVILSLIFFGVLLSSFGEKFWLLDLFSHFYLHYWLVLVVLLNVFMYKKMKFQAYLAALLLIVVSLELGAVVLNRAPMVKIGQESARIRILEFNTQGNIKVLENWLPAQAGTLDVVVLLEAHPHFQELFDKLKTSFPYQVHHLEKSPFGIAVLSRWEITASREFQSEGGFYPQFEVQIKMPSGDEFSLLAVHAPPPFAPQLAEAHEVILGELADKLAQKKLPSIVVGDLNTTARSHRFTKLVKATGLRDTAGLSPWANTWPSVLVNFVSVLGIRIDQCLVSNSFSLVERERLGDLGSDHLPVRCVVQLEK
jgi:endonuclease/exonuclease/phosphatase (EEP) superfamily protein YafD